MRTFLGVFVTIVVLITPQYSSAADPEWSGECTGVSQGDMFAALNNGQNVQVRIWGIDAPDPGEDYNIMAMMAASQILSGKVVTVEEVMIVEPRTVVGKVRLGEKDVAVALVAAGAAKCDPRYAKSTDLAEAENEARANKRGLWKYERPTLQAEQSARGTTADKTHEGHKAAGLAAKIRIPEGTTIDSRAAPPKQYHVDTEEGPKPGDVKIVSFRGYLVDVIPEGDNEAAKMRINLRLVLSNTNSVPSTATVRFQLRTQSQHGSDVSFHLVDEFTKKLTVPASSKGQPFDLLETRESSQYLSLPETNRQDIRFSAEVVE